MKSEPKCPYCGRGMLPEYTPPEDHYYRCLYCKGVQSPARSTPFEAFTAANSRHIQKNPLTLEEMFELIGSGKPFATHCESFEDPITYVNLWIDNKVIEPIGKSISIDKILWDAYGKTWRCWATKPTDEERAAAQWEE